MSTITFTDIKIIDSVCPGVALIFTVVRLALRVQSGRIWWDDALALLASLCLILTSVATGLHYSGPYSFTLVTRLAAYYCIAEGFYATLWAARLSILFSIIRIVPEKAQKRFLYNTAIAFAAVLLFLLAQVFWVCEAQAKQTWKTAPNPQCSLGLQVAVCQLITDIVSDALLIVVPIRLLARTNLERGLKIRLLIIFSAAILTTVVSLVHAAYILEVRGVDAIISAIVEISVAIIVSNLVVVVPAFSRACGSRHDDSDSPRGTIEPSFRASSFRFATSVFRFGRTDNGTAGSVSYPGPVALTVTGTGTEASSFGVGTTVEGAPPGAGEADARAEQEREKARGAGRVRWEDARAQK